MLCYVTLYHVMSYHVTVFIHTYIYVQMYMLQFVFNNMHAPAICVYNAADMHLHKKLYMYEYMYIYIIHSI